MCTAMSRVRMKRHGEPKRKRLTASRSTVLSSANVSLRSSSLCRSISICLCYTTQTTLSSLSMETNYLLRLLPLLLFL